MVCLMLCYHWLPLPGPPTSQIILPVNLPIHFQMRIETLGTHNAICVNEHLKFKREKEICEKRTRISSDIWNSNRGKQEDDERKVVNRTRKRGNEGRCEWERRQGKWRWDVSTEEEEESVWEKVTARRNLYYTSNDIVYHNKLSNK